MQWSRERQKAAHQCGFDAPVELVEHMSELEDLQGRAWEIQSALDMLDQVWRDECLREIAQEFKEYDNGVVDTAPYTQCAALCDLF